MKINRRDFLKLGAAGFGALAFHRIIPASAILPEFPNGPRLGRVFYDTSVEIKQQPDPDSATIGKRFDDYVFVINKEVIGAPITAWGKNRTWYETTEGYIPSTALQPVKNNPNNPLETLPTYGEKPGFWAEVTVPYVDIYLDGFTIYSPRLKTITRPRFYFSQVLWVDNISTNSSGEAKYHLIEKYGNLDKFWADGRAFKPLTPEDVSPISPDVSNKWIKVNVTHQTLSCYENDKEILFTRVSTGAIYNNEGKKVDKWATPLGDYHAVNRKYISLHMAGGDENKASGYEEFAVSYSSIFASGGVAIHSTYWHNNFGEPMSHGCVNVQPDVAKFVFRWTQPNPLYEAGLVEIQGYSGTKVKVQEG